MKERMMKVSQRSDVLNALRVWGEPVRPVALARFMGQTRSFINHNLTALYALDLVDRKPHPSHGRWFVYYPKKTDYSQ